MRDHPYHHGDLREALVRAGVAAARVSGPSAIILRDLATSVGVSPTAAYRHFSSLEHLQAAVGQRAREELGAAMRDAMDAVEESSPGADPVARAWDRLLASGRAYVTFATSQARLFETAFAPCDATPSRPDDPDAWALLVGAIDELDSLGAIHAVSHGAAPLIAWSAVHGLAGILTNTPLPPGVDVEAATNAVLDAVKRGLRA